MGLKKRIQSNPSLAGMAEIIPDVTFSRAGGEALKMQLIVPWAVGESRADPEFLLEKRYPLVVFVQGSGWTFPNVWYEMPQLCALAREGFVVAAITHRNALEGNPFPACLQDVKTALRYLRANAEEYGIDADRAGLWGTSSGANLSLLAAMTVGDPRYETEEYRGYSDDVDYVAACFPTTDFVEYMLDETSDPGIKDVFAALSGGTVDEEMSVLKKMSPCYYVQKYLKEKSISEKCLKEKTFSEKSMKTTGEFTCPPIFLAHGNRDALIPCRQTEKLYELLDRAGADVTMVTVEGAPHEGSFWSDRMLQLIYSFIRENAG